MAASAAAAASLRRLLGPAMVAAAITMSQDLPATLLQHPQQGGAPERGVAVAGSGSEWPVALAASVPSSALSNSSPSTAPRKPVRPGFVTTPIECDDGTTVIPWSCPSREQQLDRMEHEAFDIVVIGGGCVGAGCAFDAATRGLKVALVEQADFSSGTSSRSTKLIHGGVRYLEQAVWNLDREMWDLVDEALTERAYMLQSAPFMAKALPIMVPIYKWWEVPYMWIGCKMYDLLAGSHRQLPPSYFINSAEALFQFPMLKEEGLKGAIVYYDGQHNDTRMNLLIALTAAQQGAAVANYVAVTSLSKTKEGAVNGVFVKDLQTGKEWRIRSKAVINATGPFCDSVRHMDDPSLQPLVVPSAGSHIVLPDHFSPARMGFIIPKTSDGRVLFFLPWEGATVVGTTDHDSPITMDPMTTEEEVSWIVAEANRYLNKTVRRSDVRACWAGIRPLVRDPKALASGNTAKLSRQHVVEVSKSNLVTITGGKWTTYRRMAQDAVDAVISNVKTVQPISKSQTLTKRLLGSDRAGVVVRAKFDRIVITLREKYNFDSLVAAHLVSNYGTRALQIAEICRREPKLATRLAPTHPIIEAEVIFAVEQEYAMHVTDVIARRTRLAFLDEAAAEKALNRVVDLMAEHLKWDKSYKTAERNDAKKFLKTMLAEPVPAE